jgi:hypothetical protein
MAGEPGEGVAHDRGLGATGSSPAANEDKRRPVRPFLSENAYSNRKRKAVPLGGRWEFEGLDASKPNIAMTQRLVPVFCACGLIR